MNRESSRPYSHGPATCGCDKCTAKRKALAPKNGRRRVEMEFDLAPRDLGALGLDGASDDNIRAVVHMILGAAIREARQEQGNEE